jgi:hypothetical protein
LKYCLAPSPFFGLIKGVSAFFGQGEGPDMAGMLAVNVPLAVLVSLLARKERLRIRDDIVDPI